MLLSVVKRIQGLLPQALGRVGCERLLQLVDEAMGDDLRRYPDGRMLIWDIARHDGYNIPAYPMAGCGDVREFLSDEDVRNVPEWYEHHLGIGRDVYDEMYRYELVMVRNQALWRRVFVVPSGRLKRMDTLLEELDGWLGFGLGSGVGDFKR